MKRWLLAIALASVLIILICGAVQTLAHFAQSHETLAAIVFFAGIVLAMAVLIRPVLK